ncbi:enoyl-CoA hydratase-related protein [Nocardia gamkensis]|uniref:enoyl-CoA hydratase-related protein n=1 Tax=Nocardia gamkensis TaxID=352869 RepID=UPI0037CB0F21
MGIDFQERCPRNSEIQVRQQRSIDSGAAAHAGCLRSRSAGGIARSGRPGRGGRFGALPGADRGGPGDSRLGRIWPWRVCRWTLGCPRAPRRNCGCAATPPCAPSALPEPAIAADNGAPVGAGRSLAPACDQIVAAGSASFTHAFAEVGLTLDAGASALLSALGRAARMALSAGRVVADTALGWGMVDEVVADEALDDRAAELALRVAADPTAAFAATKRSSNTAVLPRLDAACESEVRAQTRLVDARDFREGVAAFTGKRPPVFEGR